MSTPSALVTTRPIDAFIHDELSGAREQFTLPQGTRVKHPEADHNDPIYGEPVVWMRAKVDGTWQVVGVRGLPVLKSGWRADYFMALTYQEASGMSYFQAKAIATLAAQLLGRPVTCWDLVR